MSKSNPNPPRPRAVQTFVKQIGVAEFDKPITDAALTQKIQEIEEGGATYVESFIVPQPIPAMNGTGVRLQVFAVFQRPKGESSK